jgi:type II secretory pathway pseudopilin PulG
MGVVGVLAGLLLPALVHAKERALMTTCVNNLRQINLAAREYIDDHRSRMPLSSVIDSKDHRKKNLGPTLGGHSATGKHAEYWASAESRPLYPYLKPSEVFKCPADKGQKVRDCSAGVDYNFKPSNYASLGCSYDYNYGKLAFVPPGGLREPREGPLAGQLESWVREPSLYIFMHEPPARLYSDVKIFGGTNTSKTPTALWTQWHYSLGETDIIDPAYARKSFISPVLFVDGHVAVHDFSDALINHYHYPYERTKNWMWYQPALPKPDDTPTSKRQGTSVQKSGANAN